MDANERELKTTGSFLINAAWRAVATVSAALLGRRPSFRKYYVGPRAFLIRRRMLKGIYRRCNEPLGEPYGTSTI
ncbi:MAG: hypothetical protein HY735_14035 [Verrucomicrobia bacterium]|nr:hypothetical protein [Verrucomicrobiota bacterium]